jgi:hypothetical protein
MAIAALSTASLSQYISASSNVGKSQAAWQSLEQSLATGNLTAAQSAFNTYQQLNQNLSAAGGSNSAAASKGSSQLSTDMATLGSAIGSGDVSTAQQAFASVQSDLKTTPSQAMASATAAVAQTVQWVDDLLNLSSANSSTAAPVDPATAILDSAYGQKTQSSSTDPTTSILDSAYDSGSTSSSAGSGTGNASSAASALSAGNEGSGASVNVYA